MQHSTSIRDTAAQDQAIATPAARRRTRLILVGGAVLVLLLAAAWVVRGWTGGTQSVDADALRIAVVTRGDLTRDISADGRVIAANSPTLYAIAGGTVALKVVAGDAVKKNQALAEIASPELRSQLVQAESTLATLEGEARGADLDAAIARSAARTLLDQAMIDHTAAERDLERYRNGFERGALAAIDVARAQDGLTKSEIGVAAARRGNVLRNKAADIDRSNKNLIADRQRAVVEEFRRQVLALTLRAPFDGQVGQVQVAQGTSVIANAPILSVVDLSVFEVEIKVPESFARDLGIGLPAQISSNSQQYPAHVAAVSPEVVNGEVNARLRFEEGQQPPGLRQNQRLSARIVLDTRRNVLMIERGPFAEEDGGRFAWVLEGNVAVRRPVRLGVSSLSAIEILSGMSAGERVVVSGTSRFANAERIRISGATP